MARTPTPVAAIASTAALLAALIAVSPAEGVPSHECSGARPGAVLVVPLASPIDPRPYPTFGFMFNGSDGHRYATTAGHVPLGLESGERTWGSGQGTVAFDVEGNRVGEFVYAINTRAEARPDPLPPGADLALIRVDGAGDIDNEVCGFGGPRGVDERIEAAVVSRSDPDVGEAIVAYVTLKAGIEGTEALIAELREHVANKIGKIARPHAIVLTDDLPKTRSGKIMRRLLRDVARAHQLGDVTTLANAEVVEEIRTLASTSRGIGLLHSTRGSTRGEISHKSLTIQTNRPYVGPVA
jgi:hypothetical protein